jgi:type VI protein secretion system component Hcp
MVHARPLRAIGTAIVVCLLAWAFAALPGRQAGDTARAAAAGPAGELQIEDLAVTAPIARTNFKATASAGGASGGTTGEISFEPFVVQRTVDEHSPVLMETMARGLHLGEAIVRLYRPGTTRPLVTYSLRDVVLTLLEQKGATETVGLSYGAIEMSSGGKSACYDHVGDATC